MKIVFHLEFLKPGKKISQAFKSDASLSLFTDYISRIGKYTPCEISGSLEKSAGILTPNDRIWLCDRGAGAKILSSDDVAISLRAAIEGSTKNLRIVIGGPDGFSPEWVSRINPKLRWSFGPMTLPHELASVVASEQCYRAWTILKGEPYHLGHR